MAQFGGNLPGPGRREQSPAALRRAGERQAGGNVILELCLVLPFLLLVIAGIVDLGIVYWEKHILTNASREGARAAARAGANGVADKSVAQVRQVVQGYLDKFQLKDQAGQPLTLITDSNFFCQWDITASPPQVSVEIKNIPVKLMLLPHVAGGWGDQLNLKAKTTMAAEWSTPPS